MKERDNKGRFIKKKDLRKQKRNQKLKGVEEGIIKEDIFKRKYNKINSLEIFILLYIL